MSGISGVTSEAGVNKIDKQFSEERWLSGGILLVKGGKWGDKLNLQIVDVTGLLGYGTEFVLRTFAEDFYINPDATFQIRYDVPYIGKLPSFLTIRIAYNATDADERKIALNLVTHIPN
jgi:hypothetical protein